MNKQGRKSLSQKQSPIEMDLPDDMLMDMTKLDAALQAELEEKGLVARFVDAKQLSLMNGYHKNGWVPYKRVSSDKVSLSDFKYGTDPDGVVRRGSLILAVKTKDAHRRHKNLLELRASRYRAVQKNEADKMRQFQAERQIDSQTVEGYEDADSDK